MSTIANLMVKINGDTAGLEKRLQGAQGKMKDFGQGMSRAGGSLTKSVTAPIVGLGAAAIYTVSQFDDSMSKVSAISGATGDDMESLRDVAKDLGSSTRYSASEAADAMGYLALAGWDVNQIMKATPQMLSLAAAAGMDLATAADITSDTMSTFQMDATDAGRAADIFAAASSQSNTDVMQLGEAMKYAGSGANAAGMDLEQTAANLGILADSGIKGSMAGTTFSAMLKDMMGSAKNGKIAIGDMAVELYDAEGNMRDMGAVMADVEGATDGMTTAQRDAALGAIFSGRSIKGANIMLATGSERYGELEDAMYGSAGAADDMAETMEDNIGGAFRELKSQTEGLLIQLGEQLVPIIKDTIIPIVKEFGERISGLIDWFGELDPGIQTAILAGIGLAAALGPVLMIAGFLVTSLSALVPVFAALLSPVGLVIGILVALVAGIMYLWHTNEDFRDAVIKIWEKIKAVGVAIFGALQAFWKEHGEAIMDMFKATWEFISTLVTTVFNAIATIAKAVFGALQRFWDKWGGHITSIFSAVWDQVKNIFETAVKIITNVFKLFTSILTGDWEGAWEAIKNIGKAAWDFITRTIENLAKILSTIWDGIKTDAIRTWENLKNAVTNKAQEVYANIKEKLEIAWDYIKGIPALALQWGKDIIQGLINGIKNMAGNLGGALKNVVNNAVDGVKSFLGLSSPSKLFEGFGVNVGEGFEHGIESMKRSVSVSMEHLVKPPQMAMAGGGSVSGSTGGGSQTIVIELDGRQIARSTGKYLPGEVRIKTGLRD